jgi:hypothetical protein
MPAQKIARNSAANEQIAKNSLYSKDVIEAVEKRNSSVEKDPNWIDFSYSGISIKKLNDVPDEEYPSYGKYVDNESVYIIVHPAYYLFFHNKKPQITRSPYNLYSNIMDLFIDEKLDDPILKLAQVQQKNEKNFIEYITADEKLLILILPKNYREHQSYAYGEEFDEFARYINEITNSAKSALYIESNSSASGKLLTDDLIMLLTFLEKIGAKRIFIGGGYVGRCQKDFYNYISSFFPSDDYFIVPEISTFSPSDISSGKAAHFLDGEEINLTSASEFIISKTSSRVQLQHLSSQQFDSVVNSSP